MQFEENFLGSKALNECNGHQRSFVLAVRVINNGGFYHIGTSGLIGGLTE